MKQTVSSPRRLELPRNAAEWLEAIMNFLFFLCGILAVGCVVLISAYMVISGVPAIRQIGLFQFLFGTEWASTAADPKFGILPFLLSSIYGTLGATLIGVPVGLLTAVFLSKAAGPRVRAVVVTAIELLSDLEALKAALAEMGRSSADAVEDALEALCTADADAAAGIVKGDGRINNMERDIEHRCMTLLLRQQPVAGDLRRISTAMKVVTDMERIGDHAADIAEIIPHLVTVRKEGDPAVSQAIRMGQKAHQMILDALAALTAEDETAARKVIAADDEVDYDFNAIKHTLAREIAADPGKVDAALDLLMVIKYLERIGDHAVNLAEWVEFVRTGCYHNETLF